jgi:hypothetical protein
MFTPPPGYINKQSPSRFVQLLVADDFRPNQTLQKLFIEMPEVE